MLSTRFQNQINYIVVVSYIGRGNRKNQRPTASQNKNLQYMYMEFKVQFSKKILSN
jgi:hypothetical protein